MRRTPFSPKLMLVTAHPSGADSLGNKASRRSVFNSQLQPPVLLRAADSADGTSRDAQAESVVSMHAPEVAAPDPHPDGGAATPPPAHPHLPSPTYWPAFLAFGITLLAWSLVTSWVLAVTGILVIFVALGGWIGDLLNEH